MLGEKTQLLRTDLVGNEVQKLLTQLLGEQLTYEVLQDQRRKRSS